MSVTSRMPSARDQTPATDQARRRSVGRGKLVAFLVVGILLATASVGWLNRWRLGHTAVTIADPMVRAWAAEQVAAASDNAYHLEASTIAVDEGRRRLSIDSITLTTDSAINSRLESPHPSITVRFRHCAVTGIDLTALAARRGLHALHAGCDSVLLTVRTLVAPVDSVDHLRQGADSNNFLRFQGKVDLTGYVPFVAIDSMTFPQVHTAFDLLASDGRRTTLTVDSVSVSLDSVRIDPHQEIAKRRPLFSRNVRVRLDRFAGGTKAGEQISLEHLEANLADGSAHLDAIGYERLAGVRIDSTGAMSVRAQHVALNGVRWGIFLLTGDIGIAGLHVDSVDVRIVSARNPRARVAPVLAGSIASALRSAGRAIAIDSFRVNVVRTEESGRSRADLAVTTVGELTLARVDVSPGEVAWRRAFPIGRVVLAASRVYRHTAKMDMALSRLVLDAGAKSLTIDSLRAAPQGDDSAYERRIKYRSSRLSVMLLHTTLSGIDLPAFLSYGAMRAQLLDIRGLAIDVMNDKHKPEDSTHDVRRTPQRWLRDANVEIQVDTLAAQGQVTYRERDDDATDAGVLSFRSLQLRGYNFSTDPRTMSAQTPFRLIGDAKLMGAGAMHVEWSVPLLSRAFAMTWKGSLGKMDPKAMNAFLPDAVGMRFTDGVFEGAEWRATVKDGLAEGTMEPRWRGLSVELPGVARKKSGFFGSIARGVAKLATNTFGIRGDNYAAPGRAPLNGVIKHQWIPKESLPDFIWSQLGDALLSVLKK